MGLFRNTERETDVLECCPHCQCDGGFYQKFRVSGWSQENYSFKNGDEADNSQMWDAINSSYSKKAYCLSCDKEIKELYDNFPQ